MQSHASSHPETADEETSPGKKCTLCDETSERPLYFTSFPRTHKSVTVQPNLHKWTCHAVLIACTHAPRGCPSIMTRSALASHLASCPFEALGAFFEVNDARLKRMEERQNDLSAQVDHLKRELNRTRQASMQRQAVEQSFTGVSSPLDVAILRGGLGPGGQTATPRSGSTSPTTAGPAVGTGGSSVGGTTGGISVSRAFSTSIGPGGLTTSMPSSRSDERSRPPAPVLGNGRNMFSPSFGSHQTFADWAFQRLSDIPRGTDGGDELVLEMRAVLLHLASALDSMERRNEV